MRIRSRRWARWLAIAGVVLAAYAALGFWALPFTIERQLPRLVSDDLQRRASVQDVHFNPFTLRLETGAFLLAEADGSPVFAARRLVVQMQWRSIVRRAWSFAEVRLVEPQASFIIAADGRFNVAELLDAAARRWAPDPAGDAGPPRLSMETFAVEQGKLQFEDRRAGYGNALSPIDLTLAHFSTLPGETDQLSLGARTPRGGKVHWRGQATLNPIRGSGELALEDISLPELAVYLKPYTHARLAAGRLAITLPYRFSYDAGKWDAAVAGARLGLRELAFGREGASEAFATLSGLDMKDIHAAWPARQVTVGEMRAAGGKLAVLRDARGELDLEKLFAVAGAPAPALPEATVAVDRWKFAVGQVLLDGVALQAVDETVQPPLRLSADRLRLQLKLASELAGEDLQLKIEEASGSASGLALAHGDARPLRLAEVGFDGGSIDLGARRAAFSRLHARGGALQLARTADGRINIVDLLPRPGPAREPAPSSAPAPWTASVKRVELSDFSADLHDEGSGVKLHVREAAATADDASSDLKRPVAFDARLRLEEGGVLAVRGKVVPDTAAVQADVRVGQVALAALQPLVDRHVKLKVAQGSVSAQGRVTSSPAAKLRYVGSVDVAGLVLQDEAGAVFAAWRNFGAEQLTASLGPDKVDIPELRVSDLKATLIIDDDRSLRAARLVLPSPPAAPAAPAAAGDTFPVHVRRLRLQNATVDFADLSLRPQFAAKIHELQGVVTGLSTLPDARTQLELDGRVDEFGSVRARGDLNVFAPAQQTDVNVVFRNVDMVPASPYSSKFAGYKVAEGKISLDLQYKLRDRKLQGENQIVIDRLTLGEPVDSPDAMKLPLQLAIAILKDKDGRIDLGLPVSGDLSDPQFSYGAIIWKAIGALLTKIVTAPFRALGAMLGVDGEQLEAVRFDAGSARLQPPEREKIRQVAQLLEKKPQLTLSVPAQYAEAADAAALRQRELRLEVARRAGIQLEAGEAPGPLDLADGDVRKAVRELYASRFGEAELDKQKQAAESAMPAASAGAEAKSARQQVPLWRRVGQVVQGEPQVPDSAAFYQALLQRLEASQPLPADAMVALASRRAQGIVTALTQAGVDATRLRAGSPERLEAPAQGPVALKLALDAR